MQRFFFMVVGRLVVSFVLTCAVFESARMLLEAACEPRGVHFSAALSEAFTGCFLHLFFFLGPILHRSVIAYSTEKGVLEG